MALEVLSGLVEYLIIAIVSGSLYALFAAGLALIFGVMKVINFAHGIIFTLGAYVTFVLVTLLGAPPILSILGSFAIIFLLGLILETSLIRTLRNRVALAEQFGSNALILTLGLSILLENLIIQIFTSNPVKLPPFFPGHVKILGLPISVHRILVVIVSVCALLALFLFVNKTKLGTAIRAVSQDANTARCLGISVDRIHALTFGLSSGLAAVGGALLGPLFYIDPFMGLGFSVRGFVIIIVGGMGNMLGALASAYLIGIIETFTIVYLGLEQRTTVALLFMILILVVRPSGLFGKEVRV